MDTRDLILKFQGGGSRLPREDLVQHLASKGSSITKNPDTGIYELVDKVGAETRPVQDGMCWNGDGTTNYIEISGLLTTDIITAESTIQPTCTINDRLDFTGKVYGIKIYRAGALWAEFPCEEQAGNIAHSIDTSHKTGTIHGTIAGFHAIDKTREDSRCNEVGYNNLITFNGTSSYIEIEDAGDLGQLHSIKSVDIDSHQGLAVSNEYIYTFDTETIYKRDKDSYVIISQNDAPFEPIPNINHLGDGCYLNGKIYLCALKKDGDVYTDNTILIYNADTLALENYTSLSETFDIAGLGTDGQYLYAVSYAVTTKLWKYTLQGNFVESITLNKTLVHAQGVSILNGEAYISCSENGVYVFNLIGEYIRKCMFPIADDGNIFEGLDFTIENYNMIIKDNGPENIHLLDNNQKYVSGFGIKAGVDCHTNTVSCICGKYNYDENKRQFLLGKRGTSYEFRIGNGSSTNAVTIPHTTDFTKLKGWYDSKLEKIYLTNGTITNNTDVSVLYKIQSQQDLGIGKLLANSSPYDFLFGNIANVRMFNIVNDKELDVLEFNGKSNIYNNLIDVNGIIGINTDCTLDSIVPAFNASVDTLGYNLRNKGRVRYNEKVVGTNYLTLDGEGNYIPLGSLILEDADWEFTIHYTTPSILQSQVFIGGNNYYLLGYYPSTTKFVTYISGIQYNYYELLPETSYIFKFINDNSVYHFEIYDEYGTLLFTSANADISTGLPKTMNYIGCRYLSGSKVSFLKGNLSYFNFNNAIILNLSEGSSNKVYNKVDGAEYTLAGTVDADTWQQDDTGLLRPSNLLDGFSTALMFDGVDDYVEFPTVDTSGNPYLHISMDMEKHDPADSVCFEQFADGDSYIQLLWHTNGRVYGVVRDNTTSYGYVYVGDTGRIKATMVYQGYETGNANRIQINIDGVEQTLTFVGTIPSVTPDLSSANPTLGLQAGGYVKGIVHAVHTRGINGELLSSWRRVDGDKYVDSVDGDDGIIYGASQIYYPAQPTNPTLDIFGNPLTNPAGSWLNNSENSLLGYPSPVMRNKVDKDIELIYDSSGDVKAYSPSALQFDQEDGHKEFANINDSTKIKDIVRYEEPLSDRDLNRMYNFNDRVLTDYVTDTVYFPNTMYK